MPLGLVVWLLALAVVPAPLAARVLLLAPLVIVPNLLPMFGPGRWIARLGGWVGFAAALPLLAAFSLSQGPIAGALAVPWLAASIVGLSAALGHGIANVGGVFDPRRLPALGVDVALGFWFVGAMFTVAERLGIETGFSPAIVLLTATHFHFAGFGLLGVASLLALSRPWLRWPVLGLGVGIPVTALGFVLTSDVVNAAGALVVGLSGIGVAIALVLAGDRGGTRWLGRVAGVALLIGMPMGIAWSIAILLGQSFLDLDTMVRTHGILNAAAVLLAISSLHVARPTSGS